jgi:hypothetical protein
MKRHDREIIFLLALLAIAWGVFLIEDGLFNTGLADSKEFAIGLAFVVSGFIAALVLFCNQAWFARVSRLLRISTLIVICLAYAVTTYSRWLDRDENTQPVTGTDMIVAHVKASDEWIMVHKSQLQRPAHWYETGVDMTYLANDGQQLSAIQLPAKFLPLKSIKKM